MDALFDERTIKIINTVVLLLATVLIIALFKRAYDKHYEDKQENIRDKYLRGIFAAVIIFVAVNVIFRQYDTTRQVQAYFVSNVAFLVAVIGFSAQQILADILAGMMIAIHRPFDVGEKVTVVDKNISGTVEDITPRHTVLKCYDNTRLLIPNSVINKEIIRNYDYTDCSNGSFLEITISYDSDMRKAIEIMRRVILEEPLVRDKSKNPDSTRELKIQVHGLTSDGVDLKATVWTKTIQENFDACTNIRMRLKEEYDREGIKITA